ncbi:UDP-N-acetylglucosamine 1-carboxyvinyltransferase [Marinibaculum pumilum]|uniref:UDP-N-acetylglucosamine 1-carboxyvinyltransferase n=1 Tax=Marinibaculum pumilum TaxID=1766165 RepID=A0ABV7L2U1_9PROT
MDKIRIVGGTPLNGTIRIGGAKNAALPLMAAALLTDGALVLEDVPRLADIRSMSQLLIQHGVQIDGAEEEGEAPPAADAPGQTLVLNAGNVHNLRAPYDLVRKMRASVLVLGPLLARFGRAEVSLPGGCAIGTRPVDLHMQALQALGAQLQVEAGYIKAEAPDGLVGAEVRFPFVSVGATENILMAAALARGETVIRNAAQEPEVVDLGHCLIAMGAEIEGLGTSTVTVRGRDSLHGARHAILPDRIESGTYAVAVAMAGGDVLLQGARADLIATTTEVLTRAGVEVIDETGAAVPGVRVRRNGNGLTGVDIMTEPYPGFPTDMQAQMMALMTGAEGAAMITETIFENRFMHVPELARMGANITVHGASALVRGVAELNGAPVMATDLRASVSLVLAGLVAKGETLVNRVYHLDRGYERLEEKLGRCGARIERV